MAEPFEIKANDLKPPIRATLGFDGAALPGPLVGTVTFIMRAGGAPTGPGTTKVNRVAVIEDAATWLVRHDWQFGDTDTPGDYVAEWEVIDVDGKPQTFPATSYHSVKIYPDLDGDGS